MGGNLYTSNVVIEHWFLTVNEEVQDLISRDLEGEAGRGPSRPEGAEGCRSPCRVAAGAVPTKPGFESLFSHSLTSWVTRGHLLNLGEHQPPHVVNEDNLVSLAGLSEESMRASVCHAWNTVGVH